MKSNETMIQILQTHNLMHIATIDSNGLPSVRGVYFAAGDKDNLLYFATKKDTRKIEHLSKNCNIAFVIDQESPGWQYLLKQKFIKGTGIATIIDDSEGIQKALELLMKKFTVFAELPGDLSSTIAVKVEFTNVLVTDNSINFGHTEEVNFPISKN